LKEGEAHSGSSPNLFQSQSVITVKWEPVNESVFIIILRKREITGA